jgi:cleavage and polyadenylation specificity factor subunit 3
MCPPFCHNVLTEVCTYGNNVFVSNIATEQMLYTEADLESSMDKIETINFHEEKDVFGIKFWAYNAGHVLGAAMFMIEIAGVKV